MAGGTSLAALPVGGQGSLTDTSSSKISRRSQSQSSEDSSSSGGEGSESEGGGYDGESRNKGIGHSDKESGGQATVATKHAKAAAVSKESQKSEEDAIRKGRLKATQREGKGERAVRKRQASAREEKNTARIEKKKMKAMRVFQAKMAEHRPKAGPVAGSKPLFL
jgi:hypothetical protein